jgi:hypothetical protein
VVGPRRAIVRWTFQDQSHAQLGEPTLLPTCYPEGDAPQNASHNLLKSLERAAGIEPAYSAWEASTEDLSA